MQSQRQIEPRSAFPTNHFLHSAPNHSLSMIEFDSSQVYQPEADTWLLLGAARGEVKPGERVLEVGTGSAVIAGAMGKEAEVIATDINPHATVCAQRAGISVVRCNLMDAVRGPFDLVLFNPPYLPTEPNERLDDWFEYALDGGRNGRETIEHFAADVGRVLAPRGRILLLVSSLTGPEEVKDIFYRTGFSVFVIQQERIEAEVLYVFRIVHY